MYKNIIFLILCMVIIFSVSCQRKKESIEEAYLTEIESEYKPLDSAETNYGDTIEADTDTSNTRSTQYSYTPPVRTTTNRGVIAGSTTIPSRTGTTMSTTPSRTATTMSTTTTRAIGSTPISTRVAPRVQSFTPNVAPVRKYTVNNFDTTWTSKSDPIIIRELRVMIANREYQKARDYINRLDFNNIPADVDLGHLYQFKGIVYYFLSFNNNVAMVAAEESFKQVEALTKIEKFKPLSLLWNAMLYQRYSNDQAKLNEAIVLLDRIINEYPRTRFANDAVYYKAMTLKKLGRPASEYAELLDSIRAGGYVDDLIFSQTVNDYVKSSILVN